jgi:uncharacterized repeat protein (TIGR03803 family)
MKLVSIRLFLAVVVLGFLSAAIPLIAQDQQSAPRSQLRSEPTRPPSHGLVRGLVRHADGTSVSSNWSGYVVSGSSITNATGAWTVPAVDCTKTLSSYASFWVGIDGWDGVQDLEQTGTTSYCNGSTAAYYAWYEFLPDQQTNVPISSITVNPGDQVSAVVTYDGEMQGLWQFTITITDGAQSYSTSYQTANGPPALATADWIAEAPSISGVVQPLADFGRAYFAANGNSANGASIGDFGSSATSVTFASGDGNQESDPSALTPDGGGFWVQSLFTLANFDIGDGRYPQSPLIQGFDGYFYGTTFYGGNSNSFCGSGCGTIFKVAPVGGPPIPIYTFCATLNGTGGCNDGSGPSGGLFLSVDGYFYGTTASGGTHGFGTVFRVSPAGTFETLYSFCSQARCADGAGPSGALVQATDGNFYGTTGAGGTHSTQTCTNPCPGGTVFKISPAGELTTLYSFCAQNNCGDGIAPLSGVLQGTDGNFYGTTAGGDGTGTYGTVFRLSPAGTLVTLYSFCSLANCADGAYPGAPLVQATDGNLYGTTVGGGIENGLSFYCYNFTWCGTVFKITPGGTFTQLYKFCSQANCADGANPISGLVQGTDGNLYGTTVGPQPSLPSNAGTIFEITPSGTLTTLFTNCTYTNDTTKSVFCGGFGYNQLVQGTDGSFYGTAASGGSGICLITGNNAGCGTVFNLSIGLGLGPFIRVLPTSGLVGSTVTILGNGLANASSVNINGSAADFTVVSDTELTAVVPAVAATSNSHATAGASTGFVTVTTATGTLTSNVPFRLAAATALALTPPSVPVGSTQPVVLTAQVTPPSGSNIPTGTVTFFNGPSPVGAATLTGGVATLNYNPSTLAAGTYSITALYGGDSGFGGSLSAAQALGIVSPSFTVAGTAVSVSPGAANGNTSTITVSPSGGFTGNVTLTATITSSPTGAQDPPTLSFGSTSPVSITNGNAGTATLTISTTAATSGALAYPVRPGVRWYATGSAGLVFGLIFGMGIPARRRGLRTRLGLLVFLVALTGSFLACGSGGGSGGGGGGGNPGTTAGNYTVTVTGTAGSTTATSTLTLTVQ